MEGRRELPCRIVPQYHVGLEMVDVVRAEARDVKCALDERRGLGLLNAMTAARLNGEPGIHTLVLYHTHSPVFFSIV